MNFFLNLYLYLFSKGKHYSDLVLLQTLFFSMLVMYSAFVLTSVSTKYYELNIGRVFEYYVYVWGAGDLIEELISCFVRIFLYVLGIYVWKHSIAKTKLVWSTKQSRSYLKTKQIHLVLKISKKTDNLVKPTVNIKRQWFLFYPGWNRINE